jgi:hypothetical protein
MDRLCGLVPHCMEGRVIQHTARCLFAPTVATAGAHIGVEIVGTGQYLPEGTITNHDLSKLISATAQTLQMAKRRRRSRAKL